MIAGRLMEGGCLMEVPFHGEFSFLAVHTSFPLILNLSYILELNQGTPKECWRLMET